MSLLRKLLTPAARFGPRMLVASLSTTSRSPLSMSLLAARPSAFPVGLLARPSLDTLAQPLSSPFALPIRAISVMKRRRLKIKKHRIKKRRKRNRFRTKTNTMR